MKVRVRVANDHIAEIGENLVWVCATSAVLEDALNTLRPSLVDQPTSVEEPSKVMYVVRECQKSLPFVIMDTEDERVVWKSRMVY